jgi:hypothetical protein
MGARELRQRHRAGVAGSLRPRWAQCKIDCRRLIGAIAKRELAKQLDQEWHKHHGCMSDMHKAEQNEEEKGKHGH